MRRLRQFANLAILFLISAVLPLQSMVSAQPGVPVNGLNLTTSPLPISLNGPPGATFTTELRIKNNNPEVEKLKVTLMKFSAYGEEGKPAIADREPGDDYFDWVTFSPAVFDAQPNEWKTIKMTIVLPKTAAFGYYYAAAFSRANNLQPTGRQNVLLGSTAVLVLVDVKVPNAKRETKIVNFSASKNVYEFLPANFKVKLHNNGNVHVIPSGTITIKSGSKQVAILKVNSGQGNLLPNSKRIFSTSWNDGYPVYTENIQGDKVVLDDKGLPEYNLVWDFSKIQKLRIGRYTAQLLMVYDDGSRDIPLEAELSFWVIPWRVVGVGLVVVAFLSIGLWATIRNIVKKIRKK